MDIINNIIEKIEKELAESRKKCSTSNTYDYAYSYGLERSLTILKSIDESENCTYSKELNCTLIHGKGIICNGKPSQNEHCKFYIGLRKT